MSQRRRFIGLGAGIALALLQAGAGSAQPCVATEKSGGPAPAWLAYCAAANAEPVAPPRVMEKAATDVAAAKDFWNGRYGTHTLANFPGFSQLGPQTREIWAMDWSTSLDTLYALDSGTFQFGTLGPGDGVFTALASSVPTHPGHNLWSGLSVDPRNGTLYAISIDGAGSAGYALYTIDPGTGAPTEIGADPARNFAIDFAIDCEGRFILHDIGDEAIYSINPATGLTTLIGPTGVASNFAQGMDFDNDTGVLYAWTYQGGGSNTFGTINLATGALTPLSTNNPIGEWEGAIRTACADIFVDGFESGNTSAWSGAVP